MNALVDLINAAFTLLILGALVHWVINTFFASSFNPEVMRVRDFLNKIFNPYLEKIRQNVRPIALADGRLIDLSPFILILGLWLAQSIIRALLS